MKKLFLCLMLVLSACSFSGGPEHTRYQLDPSVVLPAHMKNTAREGKVIRVARPLAAFGLDSSHIQVQTADGHLTRVENAVWVEALPRMLQPILVGALENSGQYSGVLDEYANVAASLELQTTIERFTLVYPQDTSATPHVEVTLRMTLTGLHDHTLIASGRFAAKEEVATVRMSHVVPAFERALARCLRAMSVKLSDANAKTALLKKQ